MYFFLKTTNPRPTFHLDMTQAEQAIMANHVAYWTARADEGKAVVFGPVADPQGFFGIAICNVEDDEAMRRLLDGDPAKDLLNSQATPMAAAVLGRDVRVTSDVESG